MSVVKQQIIKGTVSNFIGIGLGLINNIWLFPLAFSLEEIGIYRWVERTGVLLAALGLLGVNRTYVRYQNKFDGEVASQFLSNMLFIAVTGIIVIGIVFSIFTQSFAELFNVPIHEEFRVLGIVIAGTMAYTLGLSIASTAKRISIPFFFKNVGIRLILLITAFLVSTNTIGFGIWMNYFAIAHLIVGVVVLGYSLLQKGLPLRMPKALKLGLGRELFFFSSSGIVMAVMTMSLATIDSQMVASLLDYEALGVYSIAFFIGSFVDGVRRPISQALSPQFANHWNDKNSLAMQKMYARTSRVLMSVALLSFITIVPNLDAIFNLIPDQARFEPAKNVVVLILISRVIDFSFGANGEILSNGPHFKWNLIAISGLVGMLIGLNLLLIPKYGIDGVGYSLIIAYFIFNVAKAVFLYRKEQMQPFTRVQFQLLVLATLIYFGATIVGFEGNSGLLLSNLIILLGCTIGYALFRNKI
jgi:O-antigen/teichoic acid export membrane protein